jgi:putative SOS response-associated peptidase YedK
VTLTKSGVAEVAAELDAELSDDDGALYRPRYNVAPSDLHWIVAPGADRRILRPARWGYRVGGRPLVNVRGEQAGSGAGFRDAFQDRRCLVVTDGFLEWTRAHAPFWYHRADRGLVLLAGLYQRAEDGPRFTILTTRPNQLVAQVHDRMPVVVAPPDADAWLTGAPALAAGLIAPAPERALVATAVSKRINSVKNDEPSCLRPPEEDPSAANAQRSLF